MASDADETIFGGPGPDFIQGLGGSDIIHGLGGNDHLAGDTGNDTLNGNDGNDCLVGNGGADSLNGNAGNDVLNGGAGNDTLNGGSGSDTVSYIGTTGAVTVDLASGFQFTGASGFDTLLNNEHLVGSNFGDTLSGNAANNELYGDNGADVLNGQGGHDLLNGGLGSDTLNGGSGIDTADYSTKIVCGIPVPGASGAVTVNLTNLGFQITGGSGSDKLSSIENLIGTNFNDTLTGNAGNNVLSGLAGNDTLNGGAGNDTLQGGDGVDTASYIGASGAVAVNLNFIVQATVGAGNDSLFGIENITGTNLSGDYLVGNAGSNVLSGLAGDDSLIGNGGHDILNGGSGDDYLNGGAGRDTLVGGTGNDTFDYNAAGESLSGAATRDVITDFVGNGGGIGDRIDLRGIDAKPLLPDDQPFIFIGNAAFNIPFTGAGQIRFNTVTKILQGNTDLDALPEFEIQLINTSTLTVGGAGSDILL